VRQQLVSDWSDGPCAPVDVVIGTYGDLAKWQPKALKAMESAEKQTLKPTEIIWTHAKTLEEARNDGAYLGQSEWIIHLDADDTLDENYIEKMMQGTGDLRQPMTLGVYEDGHTDPEAVFIPAKSDFSQGNWLVIGTMVRRSCFEAAGGWGNEELYEDWSLWWRCWLEGAEIGKAEGAIYRVTVNPTGRNLPERSKQVYWFERIVQSMKTYQKVR
jgi:Glycosyl transferase family 2